MIVSYTRTEGLPNQDVRKVFEYRAGRIYASIANGGVVEIIEGRVVPVADSQKAPLNNFNESIVQDRRVDWWIGSDRGLYRFQGPEFQLRRGEKFTAQYGLSEIPMGGLYIDPAGRLWFSPENIGLYYSDPSQTGRAVFKQMIPPSTSNLFRGPQHIISDRSGTLWNGWRD